MKTQSKIFREICDSEERAKNLGLEVWAYSDKFHIKRKGAGGPHTRFDTIEEVHAYLDGFTYAKDHP